MVEGKQFLSDNNCCPGSLVAQLAAGTAWFEFVETPILERSFTPFPSISVPVSGGYQKMIVSPCFAKIGRTLDLSNGSQQTSSGLKESTTYTVHKIAGDGRCMFRALVQGMAANKGTNLNYYEEEQEADELRLAVMDAICRSDNQSQKYENALIAITLEEPLKRYCERIPKSNFWGGEAELLVLSKMCNQPVIVYIPAAEAKRGTRGGSGYIPIAEYGREFRKPGKGRKARKPVRLLYSGSNHYDLLK